MKLSDLANLTGNELWKGIRGCLKVEQLDWLATRFTTDQTTLEFIAQRKAEILSRLPLSAQITLNIDLIVSKATGCTPLEANAALNQLQEMAERRAESSAMELA